MPFPARFIASLALALTGLSARAESLWIEAESIPQKPAVATSGWDRPELQSGRQILALSFDANKVASSLPAEGLILSYPFKTSSAGTYTAWNRVVFEGIRAPFEWRINQGPWTLNSQAEQPVTNVQELSTWNPLGWTRLGTAQLTAGNNTLEIRLTRPLKYPAKPDAGFNDHRYISDVLHLTTDAAWQPNFQHPPGSAFQSDRDRQAAAQVFKLSDTPEPRQSVTLSGLWQYAPYDELGEISEESRTAGTPAYPDTSKLAWYGLPVPSDRNHSLPDFYWNHRFVLRASVDVPASLKSAAYVLDFECINLIQTLFVNGRRIGDFDTVKSRWQVDVSSAIKPGARNEILLVVKDTFYALAAEDNGTGMRRSQYYPWDMIHQNQGITRRFDYPVAFGHQQTGILDTATLIATESPVYVADTFVKPFPITKKSLSFEATLRNSGPAAASAIVRQTIRSWPDDKPVASVGESPVSIPPGASATASLQMPSTSLKLWWTYDATLYTLVTEVVVAGKVVDRHTTRFGNREWEIRGNKFYLNGVAQHLRNDLTHHETSGRLDPAKIVYDWKTLGSNMFRRRFQFRWNGLSPRQTLAWMDEVGMPVRMNAGTFDGQVASYNLVQGADKNRTARRVLFDRWHAQMLNGVNTWKNHPSVFIWELDNELVFINGRNFGLLNEVEPEFTRTSNALLALDPTRSTVSGGGNALRDQSLPTYGVHYYEDEDRLYPDEAYTGEVTGPREGTTSTRVWPLDFDAKPTFFSETAFLPGRNPAQFAAFGGETTFLGKKEARPAAGLYTSWIAEGYRWKGYAANNIWLDRDFTDGSFTYAWQPVAILRREWNDTFAPGQVVPRTLRVYNDLPDTRPLTATWTLELGGKSLTSESKTFNVAPGTYQPWNIQVTMPASVATRTTGRLLLTVTRAGEPVFNHHLPVTVLPDPKPAAAPLSGDLIVWDPQGESLARLRASGYQAIREVKSFAEVPNQFGLLVVGRNALSPADATSRRWSALASAGNKILFLEQNTPLHFQAIPADVETTQFDGRMAFSQNLAHPIFRGLAQDDLSLWSGDHVVYRRALRKPTYGATSLVQVDDELAFTALLETPVDQGLLLVNQLAVGEKLGTEVVARQLFDNLVAYAATYKRVTRELQTVITDPVTAKAVASLGASASGTTDPVAALKATPGGIVIVQATPAHLAALAAAPDVVKAFNQSGGYLVVLNVTPDSLASFNQLVGYDHILRPFREELVRFPAERHPLSAGLTLPDVVMSSGKRIQTWNRDEWPADDAFDHIADLTDIAPFATFPTPAEMGDNETKGPGTDRWPLNMVNGYTSATHWRVAYTLGLNGQGQTGFDLKFPRPETFTALSLVPNRTFRDITKLRVTFDGDPASAQDFTVSEDEVSDLVFTPRKASTVRLQVLDTKPDSDKNLSGIDNFSLTVERPAGFAEKVRPLLNIGGLIEYPRGKGGILLSQYVFRASETNPDNAAKKKTLLATLLKNLGANLGGAKTALAGYNLHYAPLSFDGVANLYLTQAQGWSASGGDLSALPKGANTFADVRYTITDFTTSPLESAVTLKHPQLKSNAAAEEVSGIKVNAQVDTLFFLHTFLETRTWKQDWQKLPPPTLFQYVIHYEDGTTIPVVITLNDGVANWLQSAPLTRPLARAEIAWSGPAVGGKTPTLYQYQWNNPFPAKKVTTVTLSYAGKGKDYGAPALLALTAARVQK